MLNVTMDMYLADVLESLVEKKSLGRPRALLPLHPCPSTRHCCPPRPHRLVLAMRQLPHPRPSILIKAASSSLGLFLYCFVSSTIHPPACLSTKINVFIPLLTLIGLFESDFATSASILPVPESITLIGFHHQHQSDFTCLTSPYHIILPHLLPPPSTLSDSRLWHVL
ncbi:ATP synthase subunit alpha, mitochondrial [Puccinia graminis f. sp. tritici]|uniref:ATP synthase subunit alpha, mitochondrial n=1 Tax=Puccinia graminis f. sp. tritici TaxID=56615 RepID=A0A5B0PGU2_PUCGR|nr:ATP synthase subunit alpha, mitochondrial [Puccinia graminis f. sp. tritici]